MKLASFNDHRIGVVDGDEIIDVTGLVTDLQRQWPPVAMVQLIAEFDRLLPALTEHVRHGTRQALTDIRLEAPIAWPNKIVAFPANYHAHINEMRVGSGLVSNFPADHQGFFLKANSSLNGPSDPILLPAIAEREVHHEAELAIIIGKRGRSIEKSEAVDYIFGFTCLLDMVVRGKEERVMRKSFDSFCPTGPVIVTKDEVPDWNDLDLTLTVNGIVRQQASTADLIVGVPGMIAMASSVMTLEPGDIIASGTPAGVGPVIDGDRLSVTISHVGTMSVDVKQGSAGDHPVWVKR